MTLIGIDNLKGDLIRGLAFGISLILANILGVFSLALPPVASFTTDIGILLVVIFLAPIIEEVTFRGVLYSYLRNVFKSKTTARLTQAGVFGIFHLVAYSGILLEAFDTSSVLVVGGAFLSAVIFGFVASIIADRYNNLIVPIIGHAVINFWLVKGLLVIVA